MLVQLQQREQQLPTAASAAVGGAGQEPQGDAVRQLAALHEQLENLAEGGLPALQQERARMSICLQSEPRERVTQLLKQPAAATVPEPALSCLQQTDDLKLYNQLPPFLCSHQGDHGHGAAEHQWGAQQRLL